MFEWVEGGGVCALRKGVRAAAEGQFQSRGGRDRIGEAGHEKAFWKGESQGKGRGSELELFTPAREFCILYRK